MYKNAWLQDLTVLHVPLHVFLCSVGIFHPEEEEQSADLPPCLPPRHHDLQLVGGNQVRGRRTV